MKAIYGFPVLAIFLLLAGCGGNSVTTPTVPTVSIPDPVDLTVTTVATGVPDPFLHGESDQGDSHSISQELDNLIQGIPALTSNTMVRGTIITRFVGVRNPAISEFITPSNRLAAEFLIGLDNAVYNNKGETIGSVDVSLTLQ